MRILKINGELADIDSTTAIGVSFASWEPSSPADRKVNTTNNFTIPLTSNNMGLIGFAGSPYVDSDTVYERIKVEYWDNGVKTIRNGNGRVTSVQDRISLQVAEKGDFYTDAADTTLEEFWTNFLTWLNTNYGVPISTDLYTTGSTAAEVLGNLNNAYSGTVGGLSNTTGICTPLFYNCLATDFAQGTLYAYNLFNYYDEDDDVVYDSNSVCVYNKAMFEYMEEYFNIDFGIDLTHEANPWLYEYVNTGFFVMPYLQLHIAYDDDDAFEGLYFDLDFDAVLGNNGESDMKDKYVIDFFRVFLQVYNIIIDEYAGEDESIQYLKLSRFDMLTDDSTEIRDWSGKLDKATKPKFVPYINGYARKNYITYASVYEDASDEYAGAKTVTCGNKNLDAEADLFSVDTYYPANRLNSILELLDTSEGSSMFIFMYDYGASGSQERVRVYSDDGSEYVEKLALYKNTCRIYALANSYGILDTLMAKPVYYEVKMWLRPTDIQDLEFFALYYIKELAGAFFICEIDGYNSLSKKAITVKLIKVSDRTPDVLT